MRRILVPAVLAVALLAGNASSASAFGHLKSLFGGSSSACDTVYCEPVCEPVCGFEPACGFESACAPKQGLLQKLFAKKNCFAQACEPACCEPVHCEPVCGFEPICEPACGLEPVCCEKAPCRPFGGLFARMFSKKHVCDIGCCEVIEPACGFEPSCGFEPTCGCEAPCGCH